MPLFPVYSLFDITPVRGEGAWLWDNKGDRYLDFYGGHAVISIGHSHPRYVKRIQEQVSLLGFYSNSVQNPLQDELAVRLAKQSGYPAYNLFLVSSGAEAIENALKLAAFHTGRGKVVAMQGAFHGRTSGAVAITDNPRIQSSLNPADHVTFVPQNDLQALEAVLKQGDVAAVIAESVQGVGGVHIASEAWWRGARALCDQHGAMLIADEIQAGYGRTGKFFGHQYSGIQADVITMAKGMGNGFPVGGILIHPRIEAWPGMLGTTFGGNHLACAAGLAVLEVLEQESLLENATHLGQALISELEAIPGITEVRGKGLMIGVDLDRDAGPVRKQLLVEEHIFTGSASDKHTIRLLPPLNISEDQVGLLLEGLKKVLVN